MRILLVVLLTIVLAPVIAGGPKKIAKSNRDLWPYAINSPAEFDFASKMEMLVFARVLQGYETVVAEDSLRSRLGLQKINMLSINTWKENVKKILMTNFSVLKQTSSHDFAVMATPRHWDQVASAAAKLKDNIPDNLKAWFANANDFYDGYVYEQMRLAGLFPRITSEIMTLEPSEITGTDYKDKQYVLTFDDGPTPAGGNTDKLIATLARYNRNGIFFVVGDALATRMKKTSVQQMRALYSPVVVGSHGKVHQPHPRYDAWEFSLSFTNNLIDSIAGQQLPLKYFRPPYGQRNEKMIAYLGNHNTRVMLWNIDSQDWNASITAREVADRVTTLMLLWRRGVILFHDIHPKANVALPLMWEGFKDAGIHWIDVKKMVP